MSKSQKEILREHLDEGKTITDNQARDWYGIGRLSARVNDLKKEGYPVESKGIVVEKANGNHATVAVYYNRELVDKQKLGPKAGRRDQPPNFAKFRYQPETVEDTGAEYVELECDNNAEVQDKLLRAYSDCKVMDKNTRVQPLAGQSWLKINKSMYVSLNRNTGKVIVAAKADVVNKPTFDFTAGKITSYFKEYDPEVQLTDQTTGFDIPKISGSTLMHYCEIQLNQP